LVSKGLTMLQEIEKQKGHHHPLIERLKNIMIENMENEGKRIKFYTPDGKPVYQ
jgi:hypothetical protein